MNLRGNRSPGGGAINQWGRSSDRPRRGGVDTVLLRQLPRETAMHRLRVATKLIALTALSVATGLNTGWVQLGAVAAVVVLAVGAARVPLRAWPRLPTGFWVVIGVGLVFAVAGEGLGRYVRLVGFSLLFLVLSLVIAWTTRLADIAPAIRAIGAPLRWIGLPVDDWAVTTALSIRCLPLIMDEVRTVIASRRQRPTTANPRPVVADVVGTAMAAAVRRGGDLGEVIAVRGGPIAPPRVSQRPHLRDLAALVLVAAASVLPGLVT